MDNKLIYVAVDDEGIVLTVQSSFDKIKEYVLDYYGLENENDSNDEVQFLKYHKIEYSHFEDAKDGYFQFKTNYKFNAGNPVIENIHIWNLFLDEKC
jgi:hypothetical protein